LSSFRDDLVLTLNGGYKRKLSIAIALLNNPKILIMDEPTSGLDTVARREFWDIITDLKNEHRTIIFTTQFLDEAEELSDRIAVLSKGKLFALGSVDFIKKEFGVGYTLVLQSRQNPLILKEKAQEIDSKIRSIIPSATLHGDTNLNVMKYSLPFSEQSKYAKLFLDIEKMKEIQINLQMSSLEEAFLNLEMMNNCPESEAHNNNRCSLGSNLQIPDVFSHERRSTMQTKAIFLQRFIKLKRDKKPFWAMILFLALALLANHKVKLLDIDELLAFLYPLSQAFFLLFTTDLLIKDRSKNITYVLRVMGLKPASYWFGNLMADSLLNLPFFLIVMLSAYFFYQNHLLEHIEYFAALSIAFSFNLITYFYILSLLMTQMENSRIASPFIIITGIIAGLIMKMFQFQTIILLVFYILISLIFGPGLTLYFGVNLVGPELKHLGLFDEKVMTVSHQFWLYIFMTIFAGIVHFFFAVFLDSRFFTQKRNNFNDKSSSMLIQNFLDQNTTSFEQTRLASESNQDMIKLIGVNKIYPNGFKALRNLNFGVEKGQIFCMLGPNGAGKTTTFNILTKKTSITSGTIEYQGHEFEEKLCPSHTIGICPQANTLWAYLTVQEHLRVYAYLKGIPTMEAKETINFLLVALGLEEHSQKKVSQLSGGTKRKLCVALAVIGAPDIILLDEPTTGVDPLGRNQIWNLLKMIERIKPVAIVLSTHYMEDAELVADKLGILVNGSLLTIGTLPELRKKYEDYFIVIDGAAEGCIEEIDRVVKSLLPKAIYDPNPEQKGLVFRVPSRSMKFAKAFHELGVLKSKNKIKDFSIYTTNLEQIFIRLAQRQEKTRR